jgi:hypothetical protein
MHMLRFFLAIALRLGVNALLTLMAGTGCLPADLLPILRLTICPFSWKAMARQRITMFVCHK